MTDELDAIRRVVDAFERSDWAEIDVRVGDLHIRLASERRRPGGELPSDGSGGGDAAPVATQTGALDRSGADDVPDGAHVVTSPSPGIFWRAPEPGAPPFTAIGARVDPSSTVCIIEVMKLMSHVKAGVAGEVVAIYAENGGAVGREAALFAIRIDV